MVSLPNAFANSFGKMGKVTDYLLFYNFVCGAIISGRKTRYTETRRGYHTAYEFAETWVIIGPLIRRGGFSFFRDRFR